VWKRFENPVVLVGLAIVDYNELGYAIRYLFKIVSDVCVEAYRVPMLAATRNGEENTVFGGTENAKKMR
jgi:hypothetical protein